MFSVFIDYASTSVIESTRDQALLGLSASKRRPLRFHGRLKQHIFSVRTALRALGEAIWSNDSWLSDAQHAGVLDPVITVHPDRLFFEAFSQDQSVYVQVCLDPEDFELEGELGFGTTNVDFTSWLWGALADLRTSRDTWFRIDSEGFEVKTVQAGGRYEGKVELPNSWVRGFLELQGSMAMPGTRLRVRPVDLLAAIRFMRYTKARVSPRGLRYEFLPDQPAEIVLEPWEERFVLKESEHNYTEAKVVRTWGRRRLSLIEPLLPFADSVDIYLKGRALPSFYVVKMPGVRFTLGLSGWTGNKWSDANAFSLAGSDSPCEESIISAALEDMVKTRTLRVKTLAQKLEQSDAIASQALSTLCRRGLALYDLEKREYRHRELFEEPIDEASIYPPNPRVAASQCLVASGSINVVSCGPQETRKMRKLKTPNGKVQREVIYRDWQVVGKGKGELDVEIVVNDAGRIIFGKCACPFFQENLFARGPCEHMLALFIASESQRVDLPSSEEHSSSVE